MYVRDLRGVNSKVKLVKGYYVFRKTKARQHGRDYQADLLNKLLERALDAGVNYFNTAFVEEAESLGLEIIHHSCCHILENERLFH